MSQGSHLDWVRTETLSAMGAGPVGGLDKLRQRGMVAFGVHWKKDGVGKVIWNVKEFEKWQKNPQESNHVQKVA